ncbi:MAG: helix-turn-helix domain-containing protein [Candidatus Omnitrophica bacterium]|nr:helix-turn-helix domain-containing protein [Candidatus Omnitrophota bacterium]
MNETIESNISGNFGKLPHWINDSGVLASFCGNTAKVLIVLIRRAHYITGIGRVGNKRIAKEAGVSFSSVSEHLKKLKFAGVIKIWRQGWVRHYRILPEVSSLSEEWIKIFGKQDKSPKKSVAYIRNHKTGRFTQNDKDP